MLKRLFYLATVAIVASMFLAPAASANEGQMTMDHDTKMWDHSMIWDWNIPMGAWDIPMWDHGMIWDHGMMWDHNMNMD